MRLPFLEDTTPPPFYQSHLSPAERTRLDKWFIGERSQKYYLKRFAEFDSYGKLYPRWHWAGCLATFGWLLYRKRYLDCFVYLVAGLSFVKVNIALIVAACEYLFIADLPLDFRLPVRVAIGFLVWLFWAVQVGRWSDAYYYRMARREIADVVELYPREPEEQKRHLQKHGGVSWVGLSAAYGLFGLIVSVVALQFVPIIAMQKEQDIVKNTYIVALQAKKTVSAEYQATGCPVGVELDDKGKKLDLAVVSEVAGMATDCAIVATVNTAKYPVRYLNGGRLVLYHDTKSGAWRCQSTLNKSQNFKRCL